ncbi:MAG: hypothetical protein U5N86_10660 [Planctomycetota bacterium]|nr:hypothetical protein [Planctomycetota bacterium]
MSAINHDTIAHSKPRLNLAGPTNASDYIARFAGYLVDEFRS